MKNLLLLIVSFLLSNGFLFSQIAINNNSDSPDGSAILDVSSDTKGFLMPRMTQDQLESIAFPADGLQVYCTTDSKIYIFVALSGQWKEVAYGSGIITPPFSCGLSITINHTAGDVAPVTKTAYYGTVTGIPGETSKCWITSNLGADHQADSVNEASESAAGWYWQFNRKQGYKHDGSTRTPVDTWQSTINESSDWIAANDPCNIELGNNWRIPTFTELNNLDASGNWSNWNGPWNSDLKMHAAGYLSSTGSLSDRGSTGFYGSSTQFSSTNFYYLQFTSSFCVPNAIAKTLGSTLRCVRE